MEEMRDAGYIDKNSLAMDHIQSQIDFIGNKDAFVPSGSWLEGEMEGQWPQDFQLSPMYAPGEDSERRLPQQLWSVWYCRNRKMMKNWNTLRNWYSYSIQKKMPSMWQKTPGLCWL